MILIILCLCTLEFTKHFLYIKHAFMYIRNTPAASQSLRIKYKFLSMADEAPWDASSTPVSSPICPSLMLLQPPQPPCSFSCHPHACPLRAFAHVALSARTFIPDIFIGRPFLLSFASSILSSKRNFLDAALGCFSTSSYIQIVNFSIFITNATI